jgi:putative cell wall-binding protein
VQNPAAAMGVLSRRTFVTGAGALAASAALSACGAGDRSGAVADTALGPAPLVPASPGAVVAVGASARTVEVHVEQIPVEELPAPRGVAGAGGLAAAATGGRGAELVTGVQETEPFRLVGLTWPAPEAQAHPVVLAVRVRTDGRWGPWQMLEAMEAEPTGPEASMAGLRVGTEPLATALSDAVQVRVGTAAGQVPKGLRLELIDPGRSPADGAVSIQLAAAAAAATQPAIVSRAQWGADESYRNDSPRYNTTIKAAVIHHTAGSSAYSSPAEAYAEVRGVYAYHTRSLGWSDIGYHFLVDRFGTIYEGRAGGMDLPVRGAHAGGFNLDTVGISVLGNYETAQANDAIITSLAQVTAWKLGLHGVDPNATTELTSEGGGTSRHPAGTTVTADTVIGHRDVGLTACPGRYLYAEMGTIRSLVTSYATGQGLGPQVIRLAGADRYETSAAQARTVHPDSPTVVVVSGQDASLVDGLVAAPLAVQRRAPILLSRRDGLLPAVAAEVQRRAATTAYLIGGTAALGEQVESQLRSLGVARLVRIAGQDRYGTAAAVALEMADQGVDKVAVLASGETENMIDALAVGGPAGATNRPILLTRSGGAPKATLDALERLRPRVIVVIGGTKAVSDQATGGVLSRLGLPASALVRIAGRDRYATASAVASAWAARLGTGTVIVASGEQTHVADAISAGAHGRLTLLTTRAGVPNATTQWLRSHTVSEALVVGGPGAIPDTALAAITTAIAPPPTSTA